MDLPTFCDDIKEVDSEKNSIVVKIEASEIQLLQTKNCEMFEQKCHICDRFFENLESHFISFHIKEEENIENENGNQKICGIFGQFPYQISDLQTINLEDLYQIVQRREGETLTNLGTNDREKLMLGSEENFESESSNFTLELLERLFNEIKGEHIVHPNEYNISKNEDQKEDMRAYLTKMNKRIENLVDAL